jgi:phage repressor protein C with HTH and peptisase S24 domain
MDHAEASQDTLAKAVGIKQPSISAFLKSDAKVWRYSPAAARFLGVRSEWLIRGVGSMVETDEPIAAASGSTSVTDDNREYVLEVDVRAGAGGGGIAGIVEAQDGEQTISQDAVRGHWLVPPEYLKELGVEARSTRIVEVRGDSMSPTLESGDRVMVDLRDVIPSPPGVFALFDGLGDVVKRVEPIFDDGEPRYLISSDNERHKAYERIPEEIRIIGRVVWRAQKM